MAIKKLFGQQVHPNWAPYHPASEVWRYAVQSTTNEWIITLKPNGWLFACGNDLGQVMYILLHRNRNFYWAYKRDGKWQPIFQKYVWAKAATLDTQTAAELYELALCNSNE